jgi:CPA1 family monovalent cation:H+ antiporter
VQFDFERTAVLLLLIAAVVAIVCRRLHLPYSVGLVGAGMLVALLPFVPEVTLSRELIFTGLLPPLIFEAAFSLRWEELRRELPLVLVLATIGVLLSAAVTAAGMSFLAHWEWPSALLFGVLIAATDPVSVISLFREAGVHGRLRLLVEAESLFNDGTAAVGFAIAVTVASGEHASVGGMIGAALAATGLGILWGAIVGQLALMLMVRTADHLVETVCTTIAAYGSFLIADSLQGSGVFATLTAGLLLGNLGPRGSMSQRGRETVQTFWNTLRLWPAQLFFCLPGCGKPAIISRPIGAQRPLGALAVTLGRGAAVYPVCALFSRSPLQVSMARQHVLFWGGLRGALALALVLSIPESVPQYQEIVTVTFAVVAYSIFVQGITIAPLARKLGEIKGDHSVAPYKHESGI